MIAYLAEYDMGYRMGCQLLGWKLNATGISAARFVFHVVPFWRGGHHLLFFGMYDPCMGEPRTNRMTNCIRGRKLTCLSQEERVLWCLNMFSRCHRAMVEIGRPNRSNPCFLIRMAERQVDRLSVCVEQFWSKHSHNGINWGCIPNMDVMRYTGIWCGHNWDNLLGHFHGVQFLGVPDLGDK